MSGEGYYEGEDGADELAELLNEMLPSESSAAAATAKGAAAAVINAAYARSTGADAKSKARISRAATNPQARPLASQRPSTRAERSRLHGLVPHCELVTQNCVPARSAASSSQL